jgi:hypothetical protein
MPPSRTFARGDEVRHKRAPVRITKFGLWALDAPETQPADIDTQVSELWGPLTQDLGVWRDLANRFGLDLFCGWFMKFGNDKGTRHRTRHAQSTGGTHIELNLDIYSGDSELIPD